MESSSLTPDSCVCYRQESRISRELIALLGCTVRIDHFERLGLSDLSCPPATQPEREDSCLPNKGSSSLRRSWNLLGVQIQRDRGRTRNLFLRYMQRL
jgi:hypothetical protein